jgi:hypothetical protein
MRNILNLDRYPLDKAGSLEWNAKVAKAVAELDAQGLFK